MFSPLRSNGDTEAGRPAQGRIYRLDGSLGGPAWADGGGYAERPGLRAPGRSAYPPPQADGQGRDVRGTGQALTREQMDLNAHAGTLDTPRPGSRGNPAHALTREQMDLNAHADTLDTPRPGSGGRTAHALTRGQMALNAHADTLHTPRPGSGGRTAHALTHGQTDLDPHADTLHTPRPGSGGRPAEALCGEEPQMESRTARRTAPPTTPREGPHPLLSPPPCGGPARDLRPRQGGEARPPAAPPAAPLPQVAPRCRRWRPAAVEGGVFVRPPAGAVVRQGRSGRCRRGSSASVSSPPTA